MKYNEWLSIWLEVFVKPTNKISTYKKYCGVAKNHLSLSIGELEIEKISSQILQKFIAELVQKNYSTSTIVGIVAVIKTSLKTAKDQRKIKKLDTKSLILPKTHEK